MSDGVMPSSRERCADFVTDPEPFPWATSLAYCDLCRTLRLGGHDSGPACKQAEQVLARRIGEVLCRPPMGGYGEYDAWHREVCEELREICQVGGIGQLYFGQAQKWVNITWKYLYAWDGIRAGSMGVAKESPVLHVPIDGRVLRAAKCDLGIACPWRQWSRIDDYDEYLAFQWRLRKTVGRLHPGLCPILWEFDAWQGKGQTA
jgi:hypothetical protein